MSEELDRLEVVLDAASLAPAETLVGTLTRARTRGNEAVSFRYDPDYLAASFAIEIDPKLPLHPGQIYGDPLFGVLRDSSPDRWGRVLMDRREAIEAKRAGQRPRRLSEWDFLAGVDDSTRHGALRLRTCDDVARYVDDRSLGVPPRSRLRELQALARKLEQDQPDSDDELGVWLSQLVAPGSSLGGARPKASYLADDGSLWIAKFPAAEDRYDQGAWEYLTSLLTVRAGIPSSESSLLSLGPRHRTFTAKRFDRAGGSRRHYASAMTLLGRNDGESASYLEIAEAIQLYGVPEQIGAQLAQLYRRIVFSILIGNRDDHLRNHGFVRELEGWVLSPAFDVNPNPDKADHALAIDEHDPSPSVANLRATHKFYRLSERDALAIETEVRVAVRSWTQLAQRVGVSRVECDQLAGIIDAERE